MEAHNQSRPRSRKDPIHPVILRTAPPGGPKFEHALHPFGPESITAADLETLLEITETPRDLLRFVDIAYLHPIDPSAALGRHTDWSRLDRIAAAHMAPLLRDRLVLIEGVRTALAFEILVPIDQPIREWHPVPISRGGHFLAAVVPPFHQIRAAWTSQKTRIRKTAGLVGYSIKVGNR